MKKKLSLIVAIAMLLSGCNADKTAEITTTAETSAVTTETTTAATTTTAETTTVIASSATTAFSEKPAEPVSYDIRSTEYLTEIEKCESFADTLDMGADAVIADLDGDGSPELIIQKCALVTISDVFGIDENGAYKAEINADSIISENTGYVSYYGDIPCCFKVDGKQQYFSHYWSGGSCGGEGGWARLVLSEREIKTEPVTQYYMSRDGFAQIYDYVGFENEDEYNSYIDSYFAEFEAVETVSFRIAGTDKTERRGLILQQLDRYFSEQDRQNTENYGNSEQRVEEINFDFNFTLDDFSMDLNIFEKYFYGSWIEQSPYPYTKVFTYQEDSFVDGMFYCLGFYEDEAGGYMLTMNGGVHELYFVLAASPDTMYTVTDFNIYYKHYGYSGIYKADENNKNLKSALTEGTIDSFGVMKLKQEYDFDIENFRTLTDHYGGEWRWNADAEGKPLYVLEAEPEAEKIIFSQQYYCMSEPDKTRRWIITAEKQNDVWTATKHEDLIAPKITNKKIVVSGEELIYLEEIVNLCGCNFEVEKDEQYEYAKKYCEENYEGEELEKFRSRNYLDEGYAAATYLGNENADWCVEISYGYPHAMLASYENFVFIKNGEIKYETGFIGINLAGGGCVEGNDYYMPSSAGPILHINLLNGEYDFIPTENIWSAIADINEDYFIFGNGLLYVYDRKNKEIIKPSADINWCGLDSTVMQLNGNIIEYTEYNDPDSGYYYNIETEESGVCEIIPEAKRGYYEDENYIITGELNLPEDDIYDGEIITVTRKADGLSKRFDMTQFPEKYQSTSWGGYNFFPSGTFTIEGWIIPEMWGVVPIAINFETEETAVIDFKATFSGIVKDNGRYFGNYWDENDVIHAGEIFFELPETDNKTV